MRALFLGLCILALGCCLLLPGPRVRDSFAADHFRQDLKQAVLTIEDIKVEKELDAEVVQENAQAIVKLLIARYSPDSQAVSYAARILIKETGFQKEYQSLNSVTLELEVRKEGTGEPSFIYVASEETKNTVSSYRYLYGILKQAFRAMY